MFSPNNKIVITAVNDSLMVRCPFWANDIIRDVPQRRWVKAKMLWQIKVVKQNMEAIDKLLGTPGVEIDAAARKLIADYGKSLKDMGKRGAGFPSWYPHKHPPLPHQKRAIDQLYGLVGGLIEFRMQLGKSKTAIDLCTAHRMEGHIDSVLVLVKRTLRRNWIEQIDTHCPIPTSILLPHTENRPKYDRWLASKPDYKWMIVGWESLSAGNMGAICKHYVANNVCAIIGDESTFIAGHGSNRTNLAIELAHACKYRYPMTGTVALEGPLQMFSQYGFIDWNIIGLDDFHAYKNRYCIMGGYEREVRPGLKTPTKVVGHKNLDELTALVAPYTVQAIEGKDYVLPPVRTQVRTVELTREQRRLYDEVKKEGSLTFEGKPSMVLENVLEVALRLQQIAGGYAVEAREIKYIGKDDRGNPVPKVKIKYDPVEIVPPDKNPKIIELCEFVEECGKVQGLIWAAYKPEIEAIVRMLRKMGLRIAELHGGIDDRIRQSRHVNPFKEGKFDWLVGNAGTGGMGYTMMNADINCFYSNTVRAIDRVQAEGRNHGIGRTEAISRVDIAAEKTIDITNLKALSMKMDLAEYLKHRVGQAMKLLDGEVE